MYHMVSRPPNVTSSACGPRGGVSDTADCQELVAWGSSAVFDRHHLYHYTHCGFRNNLRNRGLSLSHARPSTVVWWAALASWWRFRLLWLGYQPVQAKRARVAYRSSKWHCPITCTAAGIGALLSVASSTTGTVVVRKVVAGLTVFMLLAVGLATIT